MKVVITSRGSRGDVQPFIEVAAALRQRGHQVSLCVPALFHQEIQVRGLEATYYPEDSKELMVGLGSGTPSFKEALAFFSRSIQEQFDFMLKATESADVLLTSVNEMAAPTIAEYRHLPYYRMGFAPILPGRQAPPLLPWQNLPPWMNRRLWHSINFATGWLLRKFINGKRKELGLSQTPSTNQYFTGNSHTLLAINDILAPPCPTWKRRYQFQYTGYCYSPPNGGLDPALTDFIRSGPPPVYIGFGSVHIKSGKELINMIHEAVQTTHCRIVLGSGWTGLSNGIRDERIFPVGDTCHTSLFPQLAGIIHHGGSGTVHSAAKAGIPQFILPQIIDQHYWGQRILKLGLGPRPVAPKKITAGKIADVLKGFSQSNHFHLSSKKLGEKMREEEGISKITEIIASQ